jgi:hypothetical protein
VPANPPVENKTYPSEKEEKKKIRTKHIGANK